MNKESMEYLYNYMKPYLRIQDQKLLFCVEHIDELLEKLNEDEKSLIEQSNIEFNRLQSL